jgi:pimeloyl-ACP methyl ester carboxylesterase
MSSVTAIDAGGVETCVVQGRTVAFRQLGAGPVVVLVHGLAGTMGTWDLVLDGLASRCTVVAVALPGHGGSAPPAGDYSLEAYADCVRDLLDALGHRAATVAGHSLGGGIAMQFAYQYPERCERLVLVSSGGLGADVNVALRAAALPGSERVVALTANRYVIAAATVMARLAGAVRIKATARVMESVRACATFADPESRRSFFQTLRGVIDRRGQRVSATDRLDLMNEVPSLLVWGADDRIIPVSHAHRAHEAMPNSRLEIFERSGHLPHVADPARFVQAVSAFLDTTEPAARTRTKRPSIEPRPVRGHHEPGELNHPRPRRPAASSPRRTVRCAVTVDPERNSPEPQSDPESTEPDEAEGRPAVNDTEARYGADESPA